VRKLSRMPDGLVWGSITLEVIERIMGLTVGPPVLCDVSLRRIDGGPMRRTVISTPSAETDV